MASAGQGRRAGSRSYAYGPAPTLELERGYWSTGHDVVVGMDEVGRGAWAGPIMVGAAVLPKGRRVYGVRDSKMLPEKRREQLFDRVASWCSAWAVGAASQVECDSLGMADAERLAARRALEALGAVPDVVLVDGNWDFAGTARVQKIVGGDRRCLSIAAASVLAKVTRDRYMRSVAPSFPHYEFEHNKGYPCWRHKMALQAYGPSAIHRRTWVFMEDLSWGMRVRPPAAKSPNQASPNQASPNQASPNQASPTSGRPSRSVASRSVASRRVAGQVGGDQR